MQLRRAFFGFLVSAVGAAGLVSACATSAELGDGDGDEGNGSLEAGAPAPGPDKKDGAASPPRNSSTSSGGSSSGGSGGTRDGGSSSGGSSSGGSSSGAPAPEAGAPCSEPARVYTRACGLCGKQSATCFPAADPVNQVVTAYSECADEVVDGCAPGTIEAAAACGFCGTQSRTCSNSCKWTNGACTGQQTSPAKCMAGSTKIEGLGCPSGQYLTWTCREGTSPTDVNRCTWVAPDVSLCAAPNYPFLNAPTVVDATTTFAITSAAQTKMARPQSAFSCAGTETVERYAVVTEVRNTTSSAIKVDIFASPKRDGFMDPNDRVMFVYTTIPPIDQASVLACTKANDDCGLTTPSYLADAESCVRATTIPANGKVWVLTSAFDDIAAPVVGTLSVRRVAN